MIDDKKRKINIQEIKEDWLEEALEALNLENLKKIQDDGIEKSENEWKFKL